MRVEVDLPNTNNILQDGMYGEVMIHLQAPKKDAVRIYSSCLHREEGHWMVYVARDNVVHAVTAKVWEDDIAWARGLAEDPCAVPSAGHQG